MKPASELAVRRPDADRAASEALGARDHQRSDVTVTGRPFSAKATDQCRRVASGYIRTLLPIASSVLALQRGAGRNRTGEYGFAVL
jgi:hypothetical protein